MEARTTSSQTDVSWSPLYRRTGGVKLSGGWCDSDGVQDGLDLGLVRRPLARDLAGLVHHSDRGVQYLAIRYTERLAEAGAVTSVGSKGDSYDCETVAASRAA
jgi:hypothetical protein